VIEEKLAKLASSYEFDWQSTGRDWQEGTPLPVEGLPDSGVAAV